MCCTEDITMQYNFKVFQVKFDLGAVALGLGYVKMLSFQRSDLILSALILFNHPSLTLTAMALFLNIISLPQVTLTLMDQVTQDLAMEWCNPTLPPQLLQGPQHSLHLHN
jgi:hypothetical protein